MDNDVFEVFFRQEDPRDAPPELKALSVRLPMRTYRYLEEMAEHADLSRGAMAVQLVTWGISYALSKLPDDVRNDIVVEVDGEASLLANGPQL